MPGLLGGMDIGMGIGGWAAHAADNLGAIASAVSDVLPDGMTEWADPTTTTLTEASRAAGLVPYSSIVLGTVLVGFAQPYFQW